MKNSILSNLPHIYGKLLPESLDLNAPEERLATCSNCAMVCAENSSGSSFLPSTKCCTFQPFIPNYLVGSILKDCAAPEGNLRIRNAISKRLGVEPSGIRPTKIYSMMYMNGNALGFGKSEALLCSYFQKIDGTCSIWRHRDAVCSTYFCKTVRGVNGRKFWDSLRRYLSHIQSCLSRHVLLELGGVDAIRSAEVFKEPPTKSPRLSVDDLEGRVDENRYDTLWGSWKNKEELFYTSAYQVVSALTKSEFEKITGVEERFLSLGVMAAFQVSNALPESMKADPKKFTASADKAHASVHIEHASIEVKIPIEVLDVFMKGISVTAARDELRERFGTEVDDEVLLLLYNANVLRDFSPSIRI